MELSINLIIIIVIALIVLLALGSMFLGIWTPQRIGFEVETAKNNACYTLTLRGCDAVTDLNDIKITSVDVTGDAEINDDDTLLELCTNFYGVDEAGCRYNVCDCEES